MGSPSVSRRTSGLAGLALSLLALAGCAGAPPAAERPESEAAPLAGKIYAVESDQFLSEDALLWSLARADFVLLGEQHDNSEHHRLQARLVGGLQSRWEAPAPVAFEMMSTDQQHAITEHLQAGPGDVAGLDVVLDWPASGWPDWGMYAPIAQAALDAGGQIVAANLPDAEARAVFDFGTAGLDEAMLRRTGLERPLPERLAADLRSELKQAHCGDTPAEAVEGMFRVRRARDAMMADRLAALAGRRQGILIAGAGHVRKDRGVPWYLMRLRPGARIASLAFVEADPTTRTPPADLPYDYVWFTEPVSHGDPCAEGGFARTG